jgi:hypothetical protein
MVMNDTFERKVLTPAQQAARKAFRHVEAEKAMTEHEKVQNAFAANRERLKAERLVREAAAPDICKPAAKPQRR